MKRRDFITLLGGAAAAPLWPHAALAQQAGKVVRIGFLGASLNSPPPVVNYQAFLSQLREAGFIDGQNLSVEYRGVNDPGGPFVAAAELMRWQPDLIVASGPEAGLQAVVGASRSIPIVFLAIQFDPIARGYVASLARPGGNITGVFLRQLELAGKQLEILAQTFPQRTRLAVLYDAFTSDQFGEAERTARSMNIQIQALKLEKPPYDFDGAFQSAAAAGTQMVLVLSSPHFTAHAPRIAELAIAHRLPTMFTFRLYAEAGGLMSYGVDFPSMFRKTADYVARILKGAKPADLPIEQATKFETVVNLKTAKAIGVELPTIDPAARRQGDRMKPTRRSFRTPRSGDPESRSAHGTCSWIPGSRASLAPRNDKSRREFIALLCGAAAAASPLGATAQPKVIRRVGFLGAGTVAPKSENYRAFLAQLNELGFREGRNAIVEYKSLTDPRGPAGSAGDLLRSQPDVIVVTGPEIALQAVLAASKTVPVVFLATDYDPLMQKHVASLDKPGGNVTGVLVRQSDLAQKQIELLTEALPGRKRFAVAWDNETADLFAAVERAAKAGGLDVQPIRHERPPYTIELTFKNFQVRKSQIAMFLPSPHFGGRRSKIAELATARKLPTLFASKAYVESGGLLSLGIDYQAALRKLAEFTGKILRGEKAANLAVDRTGKLELAVNVKTAKAIGIELPAPVVQRADKVVE